MEDGKEDEGQEDKGNPTLVAYGNECGNIWPINVRRKELEDGAVQCGVGKLEEAGFTGQRLAFKSVQEEAIVV